MGWVVNGEMPPRKSEPDRDIAADCLPAKPPLR